MIINHVVDNSDVLIIGCGGAGLRAAIEVKENNLSVKVLGKRNKADAHTVLAAGGINASFGNLDSNDSWEQHFADTFVEGYGLGDPKSIEIMAKNSIDRVIEIDNWGADLDKISEGKLNQRYFGAHTYRRTCFSGDFTGQSILRALIKRAESLKIPILDNHYVTELLVKDNQCFGAMSLNLNSGERTLHLADSTIICTGGHTRIWKISSSRSKENLGDGYALALKAGCELIDMEMVQFHPTGMITPKSIAGTLVTEAVRGEGGILLNNKGERYMEKYDSKRMELSSRDRVARANYTEISEGRGTERGGVYLDISHKDKDFILSKIPKIYKQFLEHQELDISKDAMEVTPTAHYSMGGIFVNPHDHSTSVKGLYAAGEAAGGLHGANRLGGNSLAEILVFGKITGLSASKYSRELNNKIYSFEIIQAAHDNLDKFFKKVNFKLDFIYEKLRELMWKYCGVVKDDKNLKEGLNELIKLKGLIKNVDISRKNKNLKEIITLLDLEAAFITAEATLKTSLLRLESRGAHYRLDYPEIKKETYNYKVKLEKDELIICKSQFQKPDKYLQSYVNKTTEINDFSGKLIE